MTKRLLLLNGLAAFGVATYHAAAYGLSALFEWTDRYRAVSAPNYDQLGGFYYYMLLVIRQLDAFVIPAFIFISGYFVAFAAGKDGSKLTWAVVWARVKNFIIPLGIWTVIRFVLLRQLPASIHDILRPYYFIVLLIQFYLLSPFMAPLAKKSWQSLFAGALLIQVGAEAIFFLNNLGLLPASLLPIKRMLPLWFFPLRIFWFAIGMIAGAHQEQLTAWLRGYKWALLATTLILAPLTIVEYELFAQWSNQVWLGPSFRGIISKFYALAFIFAFIAFSDVKLPFSKFINELGSRSLGIYLANIPVIYVIAVLMYHYTPNLLGNQIIYQLILVFFGLAIPLGMMRLVRESRYRWAYKYLFG